MKMSGLFLGMLATTLSAAVAVGQNEIAKFDPNMAIKNAVVTNGVKWIDGTALPLEGRAFPDTEHYYDRLPANVTTNVNGGVRSMKHHTSGMLFRFVTDSKKLHFKWVPYNAGLSMDHMPSTGVSGIDVYRLEEDGKWRYVATGRIHDAKRGGSLDLGWKPGTPCLVNLPLYNGVKSFTLGIDPEATVSALPPRQNGVVKPVVFYGTSITHGGCCSRPGMGFVNIIGRELDVPVVNLGFSGSGKMEFEMSEHLSAIDASCYVLDCVHNMTVSDVKNRYEPFIRNLRAKRPGIPIVMAEQCDREGLPKNEKDKLIDALYRKLIAEGWKNLSYLPKTAMFAGDGEGTVDGCHPNDWGMMALAKSYGNSVRRAMILSHPPKDGAFRFVHWNIGHFALGKGKNTTVTAEASAARAVEYREKIESLGADFMGISEYDPVFDQAGASTTNLLFAAFPERVEGPKNDYQCNAMFSRRAKLLRSEVVDYEYRWQKCYFLDNVFQIGSKDVHLVQTHLDWMIKPDKECFRLAQMRQLIRHFKDCPYVVISGDFNVYGAGDFLVFTHAGYTLANCGKAGCLDTGLASPAMPCLQRCLDNVIVKGFKVSDVFCDDDYYELSDHKILGCTLEFAD